jgi:hypothetical protein
MRRWIQEIKMYEVINAQRFEKEYNIAEVDSLDFRYRILFQFILVRPCSI